MSLAHEISICGVGREIPAPRQRHRPHGLPSAGISAVNTPKQACFLGNEIRKLLRPEELRTFNTAYTA